MYVDPDGRFFWLIPLIGAAISGTVGYFSGIAAGLTGGDLFSYTFASAFIGGMSGGLGASVSAGIAGSLSIGGFVGGFSAGAVGGIAGGFFGGAFTTGLSNSMLGTTDNFFLGGLKGGLFGGLAGGLIGGTFAGIDAVKSNANFWNGKINEIGGSGIGLHMDETIPAGAKPTTTGEIATTESNPNYGKYGMTRNGGTKPHNGVDYAGKVGDDVYSMYDGKVVKVGPQRDYGPNHVRVSSTINAKEYYVDYGHLSSAAVEVKQTVTAGDLIGLMGREGNLAGTTYPTHVHISVWRPINIGGKTMGFVCPTWK